MSWLFWLKQVVIRLVQIVCTSVLRFTGIRVPEHIAIIMDGNRRYARRGGMDLCVGYKKGHGTLMRIMKCCTLLGVRELTVFAFSIDNFSRSPAEVAAIMQLAQEKMLEMLGEQGVMKAWGIRVRVVGRRELLSAPLQTLSARLTVATSSHRVLTLNVAFPYTGRDEISRAASAIVSAVQNEELSMEEVDEDLVSRTLDLGTPQLLVRTSGEVRLSDFMIWQVSHTVLYFTKTLWPDFSAWDLARAVCHYQRHAPQTSTTETKQEGARKLFLDKLDTVRRERLEKFAS